MRALLLILAGVAFAKKPKPAPVAPEPAPAPAPAPEPEPEPEPVMEAPAPTPPNVDFTAAITWADGSIDKGKVVRLDRSEDWYGEEGFGADDLNLVLESNGTEKAVPWTDIARIDITYASLDDVDCSYDSSFDPAMYMCVLRTTSKAKTRDGKLWDVADRHKWRFGWDSGAVSEFWVLKLPARQQASPGDGEGLNDNSQEASLYEELQKQLVALKAGKVPKTITVTVP